MAPVTPEKPSDSTARWELLSAFPARRVLILVFVASVILIGLVFPFPMTGRYWNAVFDLAHAPVFFLSFLILAGVLDPASIGFSCRSRSLLTLTPSRLLLISGLLFFGGVTCEIAQKFVARHPSLDDIISNTTGLMAGTFYCFSLRLSRPWTRRTGIALAVLIVACPLIPQIQVLAECIKQRREFPLIASFERNLELAAWTPHGAKVALDETWTSHGSKSMQIESYSDHDPGAVMIWPVPDWSSFSTLQFELFNPESKPVVVGVTISDEDHVQHLWEPSDRFNWSAELMPLEVKKIVIRLKDVASAPVTRSMDLTRVSNLNIFMQGSPPGSKLHVDGILLLK